MTEQSSSALKEIFNRERFQAIAAELVAVSPEFNAERFMDAATRNLDGLGIMQRMRQGAEALNAALPLEYPQAIAALNRLAPRIGHNFAAIMLPEFVSLYGLNHFDLSLDALRYYTRFGSAEFAIRHFLKQDFEKTLATMREWASDENEHVRRLASEGSRPRLPWSFQLRPVMENPDLTWPILDRLNADPSLYVRKSVANHLNDIGKDHPDWLIERLGDWPKDNPHTTWIIRHALRTLIKKGDARALALIGTTGEAKVRVEGFSVSPQAVRLGSHVSIGAEIVSTSDAEQRLVADYAVLYVKSNGAPSRKVFKLKEFDLAPGARQTLSIKRAIRDFTTRKHYAGHHRVELMVNGKTIAEGGFELDI
jgi:3-methyladenine DNA glycosylase AlkC